MDDGSRKNIISAENEAGNIYDAIGGQFSQHLVDLYTDNGDITENELISYISNYYDKVADMVSDKLSASLKRIDMNAGHYARKKLKKLSILKVAQNLEENLGKTLNRVKTVGADIVEDIKEKLLGSTTLNFRDIVRELIGEAVTEAKDIPLTPVEVKKLSKYIWGKYKHNLERIVRTECMGAYTRSELQEWYNQGIREVERVAVKDNRTCEICKQLAKPGNRWKIADLLKLDNPQILDPEHPEKFLTHPNCLLDGHIPIYTDNGLKPINKIKLGDKVYTHNNRYRKVTQWHCNKIKKGTEVSKLIINKLSVLITNEHPIYTERGWIQAKDLNNDKANFMIDGNIKLVSIKRKKYITRKSYNIYNLSVNEDESYIAKGIVVHNCRCHFKPIYDFTDTALAYYQLTGKDPDFRAAAKVTYRGGNIDNLPVDYEESVQRILREVKPESNIRFVNDVTNDIEWREDKIREYKSMGYNDEEVKELLNTAIEQQHAEIVQYETAKKNVVINAPNLTENSIVHLIARLDGAIKWIKLDTGLKQWVIDRYNMKKAEEGYHLYDEGIEIIGGQNFITPLAGQAPDWYFSECYAYYFDSPVFLRSVDSEMYDFLKDNIIGKDFYMHGGIV